MHQLKFLILVTLFYQSLMATDQVSDNLSYRFKNYQISAIQLPCTTYEKIYSTACHRGYVSSWKIKSGAIYLASVKDYRTGKRLKNVEMQLKAGQPADWYTGNVVIPKYSKDFNYKGETFYKSLIMRVDQGRVVEQISACIGEEDKHLFMRGQCYYAKGEFPKSLACFNRIATYYPDYLQSDFVYSYIASNLKWLGQDSLSKLYLDSIRIKFPQSVIGSELVLAADFISSNGKLDRFYGKDKSIDDEFDLLSIVRSFPITQQIIARDLEISKPYCQKILLIFPWIYPLASKYHDISVLFGNALFTQACRNTDFAVTF